MAAHPLVALDVGSTKVACAIGLPHEHAPGFELLGSSLVPYPAAPGSWLGDPLLVGRTIEQALEATAVNAECDRALVGIRHPLLNSELVKASIALGDEPLTIRAHDLERLQQGALAQALSVDREALLVERLGCRGNGFDGVRDPKGLSATRLCGTYHIVTMPLAARRALVQAVESAGLEVARLTYTLPLSVAVQQHHELRHQRVLAVDVGGFSADLGLLVEGALAALEVVPFGGAILAERIAAALQVTMSQAATWSLEGTACRRPEVRKLVEEQWHPLQQAVQRLLEGQPKPDALLLIGRGALIDGFAERMETLTGVCATMCRSPRTHQLGDLSRQVGLATVIGLLESATATSEELLPRPQRLFNRVLHQTRTILTEYF
ncbi:MAG: hypothetical protein HY598_04035 [Candidatus Omnitrophica bacterium]|nr:hypothetical protein [Candidatus Omnitrophota bacterium]